MDKNESKKRSRRTKDGYTEYVLYLWDMLKSAGSDGMTMEQIINNVKLQGERDGQEIPDSSIGEFVNRMFKTLKKNGCRYTYIRKESIYKLDDFSWTFPLELSLTPMDQLALKLGWEMLEKTVDIKDGVGRLGENKSKTFEKLRKKRFSFFNEEHDDKEVLAEEILVGTSDVKQVAADVLFSVFMACVEGKMLALYLESKKKIYLMPSQLSLSQDGWFVEGERCPEGKTEKIQLNTIKKADFQ